MKKLIKILLYLLAAILIAFILFLLYATISDFKPAEKTEIYHSEESESLATWQEFDFLIWNIGYCGLDASMDFFYDGGKQVRPSRSNVKKNLEEVKAFLESNDSVEFILLQEVDQNSKRSYGINIYDQINESLEQYNSWFGINYKVGFVPLPPGNPMGRVKSGLQTLAKNNASSVVRYSFPGNYSWPMGVFMLDRCFLMKRFKVSNNRELVVINTHNSAYDDGSLRKMQMDFLRDILLEEYKQGNYVIAGGDWNQSPYGFPKIFDDQQFDLDNYTEIEENYPDQGWIWAWDGSHPTNRRVATSYTRGETPTTLIDFYLLSPNVQPVQVKTVDLNFQNSDHQPVFLKVLLKD